MGNPLIQCFMALLAAHGTVTHIEFKSIKKFRKRFKSQLLKHYITRKTSPRGPEVGWLHTEAGVQNTPA